MAGTTPRPPRAKDVAAALVLLGVNATYLRSPKTGEWVVKVGNTYVLPVGDGKFKVAHSGAQPVEVDGLRLVTVLASQD